MPEAFPNELTRKLRHGYAETAEVIAFHPGPPAGWTPPARAPETDAQRLLRLESELVDLAVERFLHSSGRAGGLAVSIIALRATLGVEKRR